MIKLPFNPYSGPLADFKKNYPDVPEWKWWHGQMRSWAWYWRKANLIAALLGKRPEELRSMYLSLAKTYRATFLKLKEVA
ncbi:MAG TPA: hypothetical protein VNN22_08030 [Verrucomicrobiae bacterium]|nr:hypothetical protein [Verrucomicrobiae bacterium]